MPSNCLLSPLSNLGISTWIDKWITVLLERAFYQILGFLRPLVIVNWIEIIPSFCMDIIRAWEEYIQIFSIWIFVCINLFHTNIFGHSFVSICFIGLCSEICLCKILLYEYNRIIICDFCEFSMWSKIAPHENFAPRTMPATSATKMMFASKPLLVGHNLFGPGEDATKGYGFTTHMQMIWMWIKHTLFHKKGKPTWPLAAEQNRRQQHPLSSQLLPATWWWKQPDDPEFRF